MQIIGFVVFWCKNSKNIRYVELCVMMPHDIEHLPMQVGPRKEVLVQAIPLGLKERVTVLVLNLLFLSNPDGLNVSFPCLMNIDFILL